MAQQAYRLPETSLAKKRKRFCYLLVGFGLLVLAVWAALYYGIGPVDLGPAARAADDAAADYRSAGLPWTADEIMMGAAVRPEDDAAPLLREADRQIGAMPVSAFKLIGEARTASDLPTLGKRLQRFNAILSIAKRAASKPAADFGRDYDAPSAASLVPSHLMLSVETMSHLLGERAVFEASVGDRVRCLEDLRDGFRIARFLLGEPLSSSALEGAMINGILLADARKIAELSETQPVFLAKLLNLVESFERPQDFLPVLRGEIYRGLAELRNPYAQPLAPVPFWYRPLRTLLLGPNPGHLIRSGLPTGLLARAEATRHMALWAEYERLMQFRQKTFETARATLDSIDAEVERVDPTMSYRGVREGGFRSCSQTVERLEEIDAFFKLTEALLSVLIAKDQTGKMPRTVAEIPGHWIDPFTNESVKLAYVANTMRLYSTGMMMGDDHGHTTQEPKGVSANLVIGYPALDWKREPGRQSGRTTN